MVAASAGNHALAMCYHGSLLGIPTTVVMPLVAPLMKISRCRSYGANVLVQGPPPLLPFLPVPLREGGEGQGMTSGSPAPSP